MDVETSEAIEHAGVRIGPLEVSRLTDIGTVRILAEGFATISAKIDALQR
jgi:hypothetical protein